MVGASGLVGSTLVRMLQEAGYPMAGLQEVGVRGFDSTRVDAADLLVLAAPSSLSAQVVPKLRRPGRVVIDLSEAWRLDPEVPLVLAGVNEEALGQHRGVIASPNCTNVGLVVVLQALAGLSPLVRADVTTLQAASGGGRTMLESLAEDPDSSPESLAGNAIPHCDAFTDAGHTREEQRMIEESARLLGSAMPPLSVTCVRVPIAVGHALALTVETADPLEPGQVAAALERVPQVEVSSTEAYPTPKTVAGRDGVFVGRIRRGAGERELQMWIVIDNLRTGAASNALRLAEALLP